MIHGVNNNLVANTLVPYTDYNNDNKCLVSVKLNFILANLNGTYISY